MPRTKASAKREVETVVNEGEGKQQEEETQKSSPLSTTTKKKKLVKKSSNEKKMRFFLSLSSVVGVKGVLSSSSSSSSQQLCVCVRVDSSLCGLSTTLSLSLSREEFASLSFVLARKRK